MEIATVASQFSSTPLTRRVVAIFYRAFERLRESASEERRIGSGMADLPNFVPPSSRRDALYLPS